jgi:hypothetical protein
MGRLKRVTPEGLREFALVAKEGAMINLASQECRPREFMNVWTRPNPNEGS